MGCCAQGNEISGTKKGNGLSDRLCAVEFGGGNFINLNQSGQIAAPRIVRGLAVDILWPLSTRMIFAATGQSLCETQDSSPAAYAGVTLYPG